MVKTGRFGKFLACSAYPECKTTKPIALGVKCPPAWMRRGSRPEADEEGPVILCLQQLSSLRICPMGSSHSQGLSDLQRPISR